MSEYWLGFPVAWHYSQTHPNSHSQMLARSLAQVFIGELTFLNTQQPGAGLMVTDELEDSSEHRIDQEGILKKTKLQ